MSTLPTTPGFHEVTVSDHLPELFAMVSDIFNIPPISFPYDKPEDLEKYLTKDHDTVTKILNNDDGVMVGYFSYEEKSDVPDLVELINLGVRPEFQNQGFGKKIMQHFVEIIGDRDSRLVTHPDNKSTFLYKKFGFRPVKIIKNYFGDGQPRLLFYRPATKRQSTHQA